MKTRIIIAILVVMSAFLSWCVEVVLANETTKPKIAVLQFHNRTGDTSLDYIGVGISEILAGILARVGSVQVIAPREAWKILKDQGTLPIGGRGTWASFLGLEQGIQVGKGIVWGEWTFFIGPPDKWLADFFKTSGAQIVVAGGYTHEDEIYGRPTDKREWWRTLPTGFGIPSQMPKEISYVVLRLRLLITSKSFLICSH